MWRRSHKSPRFTPSIAAHTGQSRNLSRHQPVVPARQIAPARRAAAQPHNHPFQHAQGQRAGQIAGNCDIRGNIRADILADILIGQISTEPVRHPVQRGVRLRQMTGTGRQPGGIEPRCRGQPGPHPRPFKPAVAVGRIIDCGNPRRCHQRHQTGAAPAKQGPQQRQTIPRHHRARSNPRQSAQTGAPVIRITNVSA